MLDASKVTIDSGASFYGAGNINANLVNDGSADVAGKPLAQEESGPAGEISPAVTIPAATAAGTHKLIAVDGAGDRATKISQ